MKLVFKELFKDKRNTILYFLLLLIELCSVSINVIVVKLVADIFGPGDFWKKLLIFIIVALLDLVVGASVGYLSILFNASLNKFLNEKYIDKILDVDVEMFTKISTSKVFSSSYFIGGINQVLKIIRWIIMNAFELIGVFVVIFIMAGWKIGLPLVVLYVVAALVFKKIYVRLSEYGKERYEFDKELNQNLENSINGFAEVRTFNMIEFYKAKIHNLVQQRYDVWKEKARFNSKFYSFITLVERSATVIAMVYAGSLMSSDKIDATLAIAIVLYTQRIINPLLGLFDNFDALSEAMSSSSDYEKIINWVNKTKDEGDVELKEFNNCIALTNVSFGYGEEKIISNLSMRIPKGKRIGICGKSGEGKTTIFNLLNRFYDVADGMITIDEYNVNEITRSSYYSMIGSVLQDNVIFPGSIRDNLTFGNMAADDETLMEVLKKANLYEFVSGLEDGLDTEVGPRGLTLSGGQKQRIALARLFLKDPEIILLDEATSALDNESEFIIKNAIDKMKGKTVITIAHRLSTIRDCDEIFVIENGGVIEHGDHNTLLKMGGEYTKMLTMPTLEKF